VVNWSEILNEIVATSPGPNKDFDGVRHKYLQVLFELTGRNVIALYSGWLQKQGHRNPFFSISDALMPGLMAAVNKLDKAKGLDLILHTPGGEINATEQIVFYLRNAFKNDIRAIVPQLAMSAGTMIALASKQILMGLYSNLGPIDPQLGNGAAAHAILEEFKEIKRTYAESPKEAPAWVPILNKYTPTLIGSCEKAIELAETIVRSWLETNMFAREENPQDKATTVLNALGSHKKTLSHGRHINIEEARKLGLNIQALEDDKDLQNAVLSVHHCFTVTLSLTPAAAIIENHLGMRFVNFIAMPQMPQFVVGPQPMQVG
jgi:hypothetical protein